ALQARYSAEAVAFRYLASNPAVTGDSVEIVLPDSSSGTVTAEPFGGFLKVISKASAGSQNKTIRMLIGEKPPSQFRNAVVLGDIRSGLHLTGETNITGDVETGPFGVKYSLFKGKHFEGTFDGNTIASDSSTVPEFDSRMFERQIDEFNHILKGPSDEMNILKPGRYRAADFAKETSPAIIYSQGDLEFFSLNQTQWTTPLTIITKGSVTLTGNIRYAPFTRIIAGKQIVLEGEVKGEHALFYAAEELFIRGTVNGAGQFLAGEKIHVSDDVYLRYPSVLYLRGRIEENVRDGHLELSGNSILDGIAIIPAPRQIISDDKLLLTIGKDARIRGAVYNAGKTELHGKVSGSLLTFQFYFYHSPTTFINWVKDASINITERPDPFTIPVGFAGDTTYKILDWREL
ncbi:MAG: hypothetical protein ACFCU6_13915, partial [Balneolaceae bacterium]